MPKIEIPEERILESLDELSPRARREALRRLLPRAAYLERAMNAMVPASKHSLAAVALTGRD
ncbi:MAG: hypothetical protein A2W31_05470 [Planctomycetes bacterium RBG_16_64_10]|nr:MAG: hypothetical protein A2W31_05470 [Planctomycetes bacterium RBG_16_64_10]